MVDMAIMDCIVLMKWLNHMHGKGVGGISDQQIAAGGVVRRKQSEQSKEIFKISKLSRRAALLGKLV